MKKRFFLVFCASALWSWAQDQRSVRNPWVHDPVMAYEDGQWHLFSTGHGIHHLTSSDLETWTVDTLPVLSSIPQWTHDSVPGFKRHVWAPDVLRWRGRWWLTYSCSTFGRNTSAIGVASSPTLANADWTDHGCVVTSQEGRDNWNAIDPNVIIDGKDRPWMVYGSFWDGIQLVQLDSTLHVAPGKKPFTIARRYDPHAVDCPENPTSQHAGVNAIEAPFIIRHGKYYYLFVSWDYCCRGAKSNYRVAYGRSKRIEGPYVDRSGRKLLEGGGELLLQGDGVQYEAAGHCAAYPHPGNPKRYVFVCHGYDAKQNGVATLIVRNLHFTRDGWLNLE